MMNLTIFSSDKDILIVTTVEDLEELPSISLAAGKNYIYS